MVHETVNVDADLNAPTIHRSILIVADPSFVIRRSHQLMQDAAFIPGMLAVTLRLQLTQLLFQRPQTLEARHACIKLK